MSISYLLSTFILALYTYFRFVDYRKLIIHGLPEKYSGTDSSTQYYFFLKTLTQQTLCPSEFSDNKREGSLYYPLGIYWISTNIALMLKKEIRKPLDKHSLNDKDGYYSFALHICIALNVLILPFLINASFTYLPYMITDNTALSALASLFLLSYFNLYFNGKNYPIQTRNIGYYCVSVLAILIIIIHSFEYNPLDLDFLSSFQDFNIYNIWDFLLHISASTFSLVSLSCLIFICFRSSQQGSQLIISLLISLCLVGKSEITTPVLIALTLVIFLPLYYPYLDSLNFYKSHLLNRRYDYEWLLKTYGPLKYQYFSFLKVDLIACLKSIFSFDLEPRSGKHDARYKRSWLMQLLENRSFIYMAYFLIVSFIEVGGCNIDLAINTFKSFDLLLIFSAALIAPSFICCLRIFQGYGPPFHYIDFFSPLGWFTLTVFISSNKFNNVFCSIILFDLLIITLRLLITNFKTFDFEPSQSDNLEETSLLNKFILPKERTIFNYIEKTISTEDISNLSFAVAIGHYNMPLEAFIIIISNSVQPKFKALVRGTHAFPLIDSLTYSFYNHWQWIFTNSFSIINSNVTRIFFDSESKREINYIMKIRENNYFKGWKIIKEKSSGMAIFKK